MSKKRKNNLEDDDHGSKRLLSEQEVENRIHDVVLGQPPKEIYEKFLLPALESGTDPDLLFKVLAKTRYFLGMPYSILRGMNKGDLFPCVKALMEYGANPETIHSTIKYFQTAGGLSSKSVGWLFANAGLEGFEDLYEFDPNSGRASNEGRTNQNHPQFGKDFVKKEEAKRGSLQRSTLEQIEKRLEVLNCATVTTREDLLRNICEREYLHFYQRVVSSPRHRSEFDLKELAEGSFSQFANELKNPLREKIEVVLDVVVNFLRKRDPHSFNLGKRTIEALADQSSREIKRRTSYEIEPRRLRAPIRRISKAIQRLKLTNLEPFANPFMFPQLTASPSSSIPVVSLEMPLK
ncbi:MAG: hypothetical protein ACOY3I_02845 [Verrucomicrobiota bacterium]